MSTRRQLENLAASSESEARILDGEEAIIAAARADGLRRGLRVTASAFVGVKLEGYGAPKDILCPIGLRHPAGEEAYSVVARFKGQPISTSYTFEWRGVVLNPKAFLGGFGIEEEDHVKVVPVPNIDFGSAACLPTREPAAA